MSVVNMPQPPDYDTVYRMLREVRPLPYLGMPLKLVAHSYSELLCFENGFSIDYM